MKCIALSAPRAQLSAFDKDTMEGIDEDEEAIAKELQRGLPYPELRYRKDRKSIGFKYHDGDGRQKRVSNRITLDHHGSIIPSELAALCEELHIKFMELNVMTDDDCDGSEVD